MIPLSASTVADDPIHEFDHCVDALILRTSIQVNARRLSLYVSAAQASSNDFKNGMTIEFDGAPWKVVGELCSVFIRLSINVQIRLCPASYRCN